MTNAELIQLNPQHIAELRSFFVGFHFSDVEIVAKETTTQNLTPETIKFGETLKKLKFDGCFFGETHTHVIFSAGEDNTFYCISHAKIGIAEEKIIFKLTWRKTYEQPYIIR